MNAKTYWQAEIYKDEEIYDIDFPQRDTAEESLADAQDRWDSFTENERRRILAGASEWREESEGMAESTGNFKELTT